MSSNKTNKLTATTTATKTVREPWNITIGIITSSIGIGFTTMCHIVDNICESCGNSISSKVVLCDKGTVRYLCMGSVVKKLGFDYKHAFETIRNGSYLNLTEYADIKTDGREC